MVPSTSFQVGGFLPNCFLLSTGQFLSKITYLLGPLYHRETPRRINLIQKAAIAREVKVLIDELISKRIDITEGCEN